MYIEWLYYFSLSTPMIPLILAIFFWEQFELEKIYIPLIAFLSIDLINNVLTTLFEVKYGNVYPVTNSSVILQGLVIFKLFEKMDLVNRKTRLYLQASLVLAFVLETYFLPSFWSSNYYTLLITHLLVLFVGWRALFNSTARNTPFEFSILSTLVLYNTVFLVYLFFENKLQISAKLFEITFLLNATFYVGANLSFGRAIWSLRKH
jgi:hypothetical protein